MKYLLKLKKMEKETKIYKTEIKNENNLISIVRIFISFVIF